MGSEGGEGGAHEWQWKRAQKSQEQPPRSRPLNPQTIKNHKDVISVYCLQREQAAGGAGHALRKASLLCPDLRGLLPGRRFQAGESGKDDWGLGGGTGARGGKAMR